ncbi:hypothetical protein [Pollutimonas bauzanensis]|uniref:hypothetical protein n=1 Tax=Pollutimonas bauzanensis TaxID=658167 RepID=UPI00116061E1|nr:hypothetical protein [Pollutimonas bauzanensis]
MIVILLVLSPVIVFLGWVAWKVNQPQEDRYFTLAGRQWMVPKTYLVILDSAKNPGYFETLFEYPDMFPGNPNVFGNDNRISVSVRSRTKAGSVSQFTFERIKKLPNSVFLGEENGFDIYRSRFAEYSYKIYWFKQDESEYSMYVSYVDDPTFLAYTVFRSFEDGMRLEYTAQKNRMDDFYQIDRKVVERVRSFIQD